MSFSEPPFHSLPVTEHLSSTTQKSLALPFLPRWFLLALSLVLQRLALLTHPLLPSICVLSSGGGWCNSIGPKQSSHRWVQGATARLSGSAPVPPSPHYTWNSLLYSEGSSLRGCVSLDKVQSAKGPWVKYTCAAVILTHCWIAEFAPKFLTWRIQELRKSCWCTVGSTQKNKCHEQT